MCVCVCVCVCVCACVCACVCVCVCEEPDQPLVPREDSGVPVQHPLRVCSYGNSCPGDSQTPPELQQQETHTSSQ